MSAGAALGLIERFRRRRLARAERAGRLRFSDSGPRFIAGSEHSHLLRRPRGF
jgi:hypothetical protein